MPHRFDAGCPMSPSFGDVRNEAVGAPFLRSKGGNEEPRAPISLLVGIYESKQWFPHSRDTFVREAGAKNGSYR